MARVAEARSPAEPSTPRQKARVHAILRAAARQGSESGIDGVQMAEVADEAGVALATLYRYFPSKAALFAGVMRQRADRMRLELAPGSSSDRIEAVADALVRVGTELADHPQLARAMIASSHALIVADPRSDVTAAFKRLLHAAAGIEEPTEAEEQVLRIVEQTWYGMFVSALNGAVSLDQLEVDTRLAVRLLLSHVWH